MWEPERNRPDRTHTSQIAENSWVEKGQIRLSFLIPTWPQLKFPSMVSTQAPARAQPNTSLQQQPICSIPSPLYMKTSLTSSPCSWGFWLWKVKGLFKVRRKSSHSPWCHLRTWTLSQQKSRQMQMGNKSGNVFIRKIGSRLEPRVCFKDWSKYQVTIQKALWPFYLQ